MPSFPASRRSVFVNREGTPPSSSRVSTTSGYSSHLPDSNAILLYLAQGTGYLPDDAFGIAQAVGWLTYEQTDVIPMIGGLRFRLLVGRSSPSDLDAIRRRNGAGPVLSLLDDHLTQNEFFVGGRYTIADIAIYGYTHLANEAGLDLQPYVNLRSWLV